MSTTVSDAGGGDFELVPAGVYIARCYRIIDLGTQQTTWQGVTKEAKKIMISWELLDQPYMKDGRPFSVHKQYTASLGEKATLRADLEAWRNRKFTAEELQGFDLKNILGAYCQIQVVHSEDGKYANVQTIMMMKGDKPKPVNEDVLFDIDEPNMEVFNSLSQSLQDKIKAAPEFAGAFNKTGDQPTAPATQKPDPIIEDIGDDPIDLNDIPF